MRVYTASTVENILGINNLPILLGNFISYETLKLYKVTLAQVKVEPTVLPKPSKATYSKQYPHKEDRKK